MKVNEVEPLLMHRLLEQDSIELNLSGRHREEVLKELVGKLGEIKNSPESKERLLKALLDREQLHSTGIGDGIALPHARNGLVGLVQEPALVFGRHPQGIAYGSIDGQAARIFFLLAAPNVTSHLQMLSRLSRILRHGRVREELLVAQSAGKVIQIIRDAEKNP